MESRNHSNGASFRKAIRVGTKISIMKNIILFTLIIALLSCKKDSGTSPTSWHVKYEISSTNPSAKGVFMYRDESGTLVTIGKISGVYQTIPWTYEANWSKDPGLAFARNLEIAQIAIDPLNTVDVTTFKVYVDGKLANQTTSGILTYVLIP